MLCACRVMLVQYRSFILWEDHMTWAQEARCRGCCAWWAVQTRNLPLCMRTGPHGNDRGRGVHGLCG